MFRFQGRDSQSPHTDASNGHNLDIWNICSQRRNCRFPVFLCHFQQHSGNNLITRYIFVNLAVLHLGFGLFFGFDYCLVLIIANLKF